MEVERVPTGHAADYPHLKKAKRDCKTASHPLPMLLNPALANEDQRNSCGSDPQYRCRGRRNGERAGIAHSLLKVLDVKAQWRGCEYTCHIDSANDTMELSEAIAKPVGELQGAQQQCACARNSMRQQPPLKRLVVLPHRILEINQKALIVMDHLGEHQADYGKQYVFSPHARRAREDRLH